MAKKRKPTPTRKPTPAVPLFPQIPHLKKRAMLTAFAQCGQVRKSAEVAHIDLRYHWRWLREDEEYHAAFKEAGRMAADILEDRLITLAVEGYEETVWHKGKVIGQQTRYLPTLLMAAVNAALPEKYKYRQETTHELSPAMQALNAQWRELRDAQSAEVRALPPADVREAEVEPMRPRPEPPRAPEGMTEQDHRQARDQEAWAPLSKDHIFASLDALNAVNDEDLYDPQEDTDDR